MMTNSFVRNCWYPAATAQELGRKPLGRTYLTPTGNSLCRTSRQDALLAGKVVIRINDGEQQWKQSCAAWSTRSATCSNSLRVSASPMRMANSRSAAAVRLQRAARGIFARSVAERADNARSREEWIAYYLGQGQYSEARQLGWTGSENAFSECIIS